MPIQFIYAIASVVIVSLLSLIGLLSLRLKEDRLKRMIYYMIALSVGALFGDVAVHLIPEIYRNGGGSAVSSLALLSGIFTFFLLEKYLHWMHRHDVETHEDGHHHIEPVGYLSLISDAFHNLTDGLIIGVGYLAGLEIGIATTLAIILHEIPHELGNFALLLYAGFTKKRAILYNFISGLAAVIGTLLALYFGAMTSAFDAIVLPLAAGGFIYIAGSDLVPELHKTVEAKKSIFQFLFILVGIAIMYLLLFLD